MLAVENDQNQIVLMADFRQNQFEFVLQNHPDLDYKEKHFSAHRSKPGGKEQVGQGSLFRVHLSVVCRLKDGSSFSSVSKQALSDKAKFEFKVLTFNPKIVCNNGRHCITVLSDCSKVSVYL